MSQAPNMADGVVAQVSGFHVLLAASCTRCGASVIPQVAPDDIYTLECPCDGALDAVVVMMNGIEVALDVDDDAPPPPPARERPKLVGLDGGLATRKDPPR